MKKAPSKKRGTALAGGCVITPLITKTKPRLTVIRNLKSQISNLKSFTNMKTRKEIIREYKERKKPAGVFWLKNTVNGKFLLGSSLNLEGVFNRHKFGLSVGSHDNKALQKDWNEFGADSFVFEVLEEVKITDDEYFDIKDELTLLEQIWIEKLQPFGENG